MIRILRSLYLFFKLRFYFQFFCYFYFVFLFFSFLFFFFEIFNLRSQVKWNLFSISFFFFLNKSIETGGCREIPKVKEGEGTQSEHFIALGTAMTLLSVNKHKINALLQWERMMEGRSDVKLFVCQCIF